MLPEGMRVYAIGDIHGRADLLNEMHAAIMDHAADASPAENHIVYLGDYVDRGLQVKAVMDLLVAGPPEGFTPVYLRGNHEEMLLNFLENAGSLDDWLALGGRVTLLSYGVKVPSLISDSVRAGEVRSAFMEAFPKIHHNFLSELQLYFQAGDYLFVHAGIRPGIALEKQNPTDFAWIREPFLSSRKASEWRVVHGHNITEKPEILPSRIGVDTGAFATGRLSCVMLEGGRLAHLTIHANENDSLAA